MTIYIYIYTYMQYIYIYIDICMYIHELEALRYLLFRGAGFLDSSHPT